MNSPFEDYRTVLVRNEKPHWRSIDDIRQGRICAQPGVFIPPDQVLYEPWVCLPTRDAEPWGEPLE